jgi:serine protease inhibitor
VFIIICGIFSDLVGSKILELPYSNTRYSLFIVLPKASVGVQRLEQALMKRERLDDLLLTNMPAPSETIVLLPR